MLPTPYRSFGFRAFLYSLVCFIIVWPFNYLSLFHFKNTMQFIAVCLNGQLISAACEVTYI